MMLPSAPPSVLDPSGKPAVGAYTGHIAPVSWTRAASAFTRRLKHKRWHYASFAGEDCLFALAIIDLGWVASAFTYLFDRKDRRLLADLSFTGLPELNARVADRAGEGATSTWHSRGADLSIERPTGSDRFRVRVRAPGLEVDASLSTANIPPTLCAVAEIVGGVANCTHKTLCLPATGTASAGGKRFALDGYTGAMDHTSGVLARDTRWRWASAARPGLGLNLVEGFNGPVENILWLGNELIPVGAARFELDPARPMDPWRITTEGNLVDLVFTPEGARHKDQDLFVAASKYIQPVGTFAGTLRPPGRPAIRVENWLGVTEDHASRW